MDPTLLRDTAQNRLTLVLSFFQRVESRLTLVLGVELGMLALLVSAAPPLNRWDASTLIALLPAFCITMSLYRVWQGLFPDVAGGIIDPHTTSLIFFGTIAGRSEAAFVAECHEQSEQAYVRDVLGQVWTNAKILSIKFERLKSAFLWMLIAIIPWLVTLAVFASRIPDARTLLR